MLLAHRTSKRWSFKVQEHTLTINILTSGYSCQKSFQISYQNTTIRECSWKYNIYINTTALNDAIKFLYF